VGRTIRHDRLARKLRIPAWESRQKDGGELSTYLRKKDHGPNGRIVVAELPKGKVEWRSQFREECKCGKSTKRGSGDGKSGKMSQRSSEFGSNPGGQ